jgi:hypothetical protein
LVNRFSPFLSGQATLEDYWVADRLAQFIGKYVEVVFALSQDNW